MIKKNGEGPFNHSDHLLKIGKKIKADTLSQRKNSGQPRAQGFWEKP